MAKGGFDDVGFDHAHNRLSVDSGFDERNKIFEIGFGDNRKSAPSFRTEVIQRRKISGVRINFPGKLDYLDIVSRDAPTHNGKSSRPREIKNSKFVNIR